MHVGYITLEWIDSKLNQIMTAYSVDIPEGAQLPFMVYEMTNLLGSVDSYNEETYYAMIKIYHTNSGQAQTILNNINGQIKKLHYKGKSENAYIQPSLDGNIEIINKGTHYIVSQKYVFVVNRE